VIDPENPNVKACVCSMEAGIAPRASRAGARGRAGEQIAMELKIVEARRGDYAQLLSYMGNLEWSGAPADKVRGVLVAPTFSAKVLSCPQGPGRAAQGPQH